MFKTQISYPCAVSDQTDEGYSAAYEWVMSRLDEEQYITLWVPQKNILNNNEFLKSLSNDEEVNIVTGKEGGIYKAHGPVLAMYPESADLGKITYGRVITALCIVQGLIDPLETWIQETSSKILHDFAFQLEEPSLTPEVVCGLERITNRINHNNTIAAGYEKKQVVSGLLRLYDAAEYLPLHRTMQWCAAHGWRGDNLNKLGGYIQDINNGSRPEIPVY